MESRLGDRIRRRRKQLGMTLKDLAGDKVTPAQISAVEKGKCKPSSSLLKYISERLECKVDDLTLTNQEKSQRDFEEARLKSRQLLDMGKLDEAVGSISSFFDEIASLTDEQKGFCYSLKGDWFYNSEEYNSAFNLYIKALTHSLKTRDVNAICNLHRKIGNCLFCTKKYNMALGYYVSAYKYLCLDIDSDTRIKTLYDLALCYLSLQRYDLSSDYLNKCIENMNFIEQDKKSKILPGIYMIQGLTARGINKTEESLEIFNSAYEIYHSDNNVMGMARCRNNAALCLWDMGKLADAESYFKEAIEYKIHSKDKTLSDSYINLAELYKENGEISKALEIISMAEEAVLSQELVSGIIDIYIVKFDYLVEIRDYDRAEIAALFALDFIQKSSDAYNEAKLYIKMSDMYRRQGDEKTAMDYLLKVNKYSM